MAADSTSVAQAIAGGTQDLAALAGFFSTDSVEKNALATHLGSGTVLVSSLSLLGILGLAKSTLKIVLGLERCRAAGFNLDAVRGLFGYAPGETAATGELVDCDHITVDFLEDVIRIHKIKRLLDSERSPIVLVGSGWPQLGLLWKTAVNLGNVNREAAFSQSPWFAFSFGMLCTGITSWLLLVIDTPWTWVRWLATVGLQACLMFMLALPLWFQRQTGRPGAHLTPARWNRLWDLTDDVDPPRYERDLTDDVDPPRYERDLTDDVDPPRYERGSSRMTPAKARWCCVWSWIAPLQARCRHRGDSKHIRIRSTSTRMNLLQAKVANGDVLHFQGDVSILKSPVLRALALIVSAATAAAYVCQYAIVKTASNRHAIIWVSCQAVAAVVRLLYWVINPSFDDPRTDKGEFALVNNRERPLIFLPELFCACESGETELPLWVWAYLRSTPLNVLLTAAARRTIHDVVPSDPGDLCTLLNVDFNRIVERRQSNYDNLKDNFHKQHRWRLAFWRHSSSHPVHPVLLLEVPFVQHNKGERECWMEAVKVPFVQHSKGEREGWMKAVKTGDGIDDKLQNTCTIFAVTEDERLHLRSHKIPEACDRNCPQSSDYSGDLDHSDTFMYIFDRSLMCIWIEGLFEKDAEAGGLGYGQANTWQDAVWVSITPGTRDRHGKRSAGPRQRIFGVRDWEVGLRTVSEYIGGKYNPYT